MSSEFPFVRLDIPFDKKDEVKPLAPNQTLEEAKNSEG